MKLCALYTEDIIENDALKDEIKTLKQMDKKITEIDNSFSSVASSYFSKNLNKIFEEHSGDIYNYYISEVEKVLLFEILKNKKGIQLKASEILGLNRNTLRKKITELNINLNLDKNKRS